MCGRPIPSIRGSKAKFCTSECGRRANYEAKKHKLTGARIVRKLVVHVCVEPLMGDAPTGNCFCSKELTVEKVEQEVRIGNIFWMNDEAGNAHAVAYDKKVMVPRAATIDRTNIERSLRYLGSSVDKYRKMLPRLKEMINRDDKSITSDIQEMFRMDEYQHLFVSSLARLTREVPAEEFDRIEREQRDVPVVSDLELNDRTAGGVGKSVVSRGPREDEETEEEPVEEAEEVEEELTQVEHSSEVIEEFGDDSELEALIAEQNSDLASEKYIELPEANEDEEEYQMAAD
jgi:hypothetical protein